MSRLHPMRPKAAAAIWPYPHRTIAEIDRKAAGIAAVAFAYHFCGQCDRRVRSDEAGQCASPFCPTAKVPA
jgi:hypothetical protein